MDNSLMVGLQTQRVLQRRLDITANNLANASTTGFKTDALVVAEHRERPARDVESPRDIRFVRDIGVSRDMRAGAIEATGNPLDLAIEGEGFFTVQTPAGLAYTRDGAFQMTAAGEVQTAEGYSVLTAGGAPVVFDPQGERPSIAADGTIRIGETALGQLGLARFANPGALEKIGDNLFRPAGQAAQAFDGELVQGALESSNVRPIVELTQLIEISRAYENAARIVRQGDDLRSRAIDRLGRAT